MEIQLEMVKFVGLWWETRDGFRSLSPSIPPEANVFTCSVGSQKLTHNPDVVIFFDNYEDACDYMEDHSEVRYIIGGHQWTDLTATHTLEQSLRSLQCAQLVCEPKLVQS